MTLNDFYCALRNS